MATAEVARLIASLELRDAQFQTAIRGVEKKLDGIDGQFRNVGKGAAIGAAAGTVAFGALSYAVANATNFVGGATQAFIDDEQSVRRLDASLRANVAGWNGNTKAIEDTIKARMKLGFADEEQRNALGLAVIATHDVNQALALEATAMDLARLKSISLEEATSKLIKVEGGNFRALKELGIQVDENATQTEALIAVQKAAEGQAAAWAETTGGKLVAAQVRASEATERLGGVFARLGAFILPALADGLDSVLNYIDGVATAADKALNPLTAFMNIATLGQFGRIQDLQIKIQQETGTSTPTTSSTTTSGTSSYSFGDPLPTGIHAAGAVGVTSGPQRAIFGEAGSEAYAILRNPREGSLGTSPVVVKLDASVRVSRREISDIVLLDQLAATGMV